MVRALNVGARILHAVGILGRLGCQAIPVPSLGSSSCCVRQRAAMTVPAHLRSCAEQVVVLLNQVPDPVKNALVNRRCIADLSGSLRQVREEPRGLVLAFYDPFWKTAPRGVMSCKGPRGTMATRATCNLQLAESTIANTHRIPLSPPSLLLSNAYYGSSKIATTGRLISSLWFGQGALIRRGSTSDL